MKHSFTRTIRKLLHAPFLIPGMALLLLSAGASAAPALQSEVAMDQQTFERQWEDRLLPLVKSIDPKATIWVHVQPKTSKLGQMPGLPFQYESLRLKDSLGRWSISKIDLRIFSERKDWPESATELLIDAFRDLGIKPKVLVSRLPSSRSKPEPKTESGESAKSEPAQQANKPGEKREPAPEENPGFLEEVGSFQERFGGLVYAGLGGLFLLVFMIAGLVRRREMKELRNSLSRSLQTLSESLESSRAPAPAPNLQAGTRNREENRDDRGESVPVNLGLAYQSVRALFTDAYWCSADGFAAWIWKNLDPEMRSSLVREEGHLVEYVEYLLDVPAERRDDFLDPAFLNPLSISRVSNEAIGKHLEKLPGIYPRLSQMRRQSLSISVLARMELEKAKPSTPAEISALGLESQKLFTPRILASRKAFEPQTFEEEIEIVNRLPAGSEERGRILSLGWFAQLPLSKRQSALTAFPASSIAESLHAPHEYVQKVLEALPEKKKKLVESYLVKTTPSRRTETFRALQKFAIDETPSVEKNHEPSKRAA